MIPLQTEYFQWQSVIPLNLLLMKSKWFPLRLKWSWGKSNCWTMMAPEWFWGTHHPKHHFWTAHKSWKGRLWQYWCFFQPKVINDLLIVWLLHSLEQSYKQKSHTWEIPSRPLLDFPFLLILLSSWKVCHNESNGTFDTCLSKITLMP